MHTNISRPTTGEVTCFFSLKDIYYMIYYSNCYNIFYLLSIKTCYYSIHIKDHQNVHVIEGVTFISELGSLHVYQVQNITSAKILKINS